MWRLPATVSGNAPRHPHKTILKVVPTFISINIYFNESFRVFSKLTCLNDFTTGSQYKNDTLMNSKKIKYY